MACLKVALNKQGKEVIMLSDELTENSAKRVFQFVLLADIDINCLNQIIKLVNCKSLHPNSFLELAEWALELRLFHHQRSHNGQEKEAKYRPVGWAKKNESRIDGWG